MTAIGLRTISLHRRNEEGEMKRGTNKTASGIQRELRELGNAEIARHSLRFFKTGPGQYGEGDRFLGIRVPALRAVAKKYQGITLNEAAELLNSEFHEERLTALLILVRRYQKPIEAVDRQAIYRLYLDSTRWINNWDLVDCSAMHIVGPHLRGLDKRPLYTLAGSVSLWERRIAMMATFHFIKQRQFDDALRIAEILLTDPEDLIHKAVGWMLREIGKRDIESEEGFLKRYYRQMPRTMLRYAIEKFPEPKRQRYLKGQV
jgi:3-methyladenine DNA glycosylase AlkD